MTPLDRLLDATERLADDVATAVVSHHDLHCCDPDGMAGRTGGPDPGTVAKGVTEAFAVGTSTQCRQADTGTEGQVCVPVPMATYPLPLAACRAMAITPGQLAGLAATQVTAPGQVPAGDDIVDVSISATLTPGLYAGHLADLTGNVRRPFLIFLDGLT